MSSITPWIDDMGKCTCGYIERIRASRPEFDEFYRKVQFDIKFYYANRKSTRQTDIFEKQYLNPMLKALARVSIVIREDSLNSPSEGVVRKTLREALQMMPKKKTKNQIPEAAVDPDMLSTIYQISSVTRRIANGWGKVVYAMCIHHSFLPQESEEPVEPPEEGELVDSFTERHGRQVKRAKNGRYLTPTERFGNCVSCSESSLVSLHDPTREQSIERSFFDEDEPGIVMIQAWRCKDPLRKRGRNSDLDYSEVTKHTEYITTKIIPALPIPTEDSTKGSGRMTYPYTLEHYKMGGLHPDAKYYSGGAEGRSKAALHAFLEGVHPDFLTLISEELELHHETLQMSEADSKSKLSARRTDLTGASLDKEVGKPASTISEIRREIEEFRALPPGTYSARSSAYSVTDAE